MPLKRQIRMLRAPKKTHMLMIMTITMINRKLLSKRISVIEKLNVLKERKLDLRPSM